MERAGKRGQEMRVREPLTHSNGEEKGEKTLIAYHTSFKEQFALGSRYAARIQSSLSC